jgi:hypothetical protein
MSEDHRKYIGVFDEDLNGCIDQHIALEIKNNKCATACVFNDIVVADMKGTNVGVFKKSDFSQIFSKLFYGDSCPFLIASH